MTTKPAGAPRPGFPPSPCNRICTLNDDGLCIGCKRSLDEIVRWSTMSAEGQWSVIRQLDERDVGLDGVLVPGSY